MSNEITLQRYEMVNKCETLEELSKVILSFADKDTIQGRRQGFNAKRMAEHCLKVPRYPYNCLTRKWGIRQQAMYLVHYKKH